ncbi:phage virion morphogenesis protein [Azospirillum picis]|uniref:Phage virion morphogenesis protein n=1 Tax=Azospirillum picis TaxID=488438 RepID=A0ABU0MNU3_9PROT|nr:phage virion morphogenesis protein [Azospirillum picis]MBP2301306.1 phage virion morphogenesis protein [Azospirillum picis]MDQ0535137.1 phage virion morphogenesis protein [Azospirillum picis]
MADPTGASIQIDDADLRKLLGRLDASARDMTGLMEQLAAQVEFDTQRRFETQTDPDGNPWPPSARALAENGETLTDTARLRQSITSRAGRTEFSVGTNVVYAAIHQFGGTIHQQTRQQTLYWHHAGDTGSAAWRASRTFGDWRFAKRSRANYSEVHTVQAHDVTMPARPFLGVSESGMAVLGEIARDWLAVAGGLGAAP